MRHHRLYHPAPLATGTTVALDRDNSHYLTTVLRARIGQPLLLFNGVEAGEYAATLTAIERQSCRVAVEAYQPVNRESPLAITLLQGISKGERMDWVVQKAVELGVTTLVPLITDRSVVRLDEERQQKRQHHWQSIAISACCQSGRTVLPQIERPLTLAAWLEHHPTLTTELRWLLAVRDDYPTTPPHTPRPTHAAVLIGPEGGLTLEEEQLALHHHFIPRHLGSRILRTETATVAALTLLQHQFGDLA